MTSNQLGDANELARRFTECKGWRWLPGMLTACGKRVYEVNHGYPSAIDPVTGVLHFDLGLKWLPDTKDAATRGAILELVREAWSDPLLYVHSFSVLGKPRWGVDSDHTPILGKFDTEIEALLAALEAAP